MLCVAPKKSFYFFNILLHNTFFFNCPFVGKMNKGLIAISLCFIFCFMVLNSASKEKGWMVGWVDGWLVARTASSLETCQDKEAQT